jgi:hypothetical protein
MSIGITVPAHGPETPVAALVACSVVNGFVNETWRNGRDGRGAMAGTGALLVTCAVETHEATRDGDRLAHNPEVAGSNPVPATKESGPDQAKRQPASAGGRFVL